MICPLCDQAYDDVWLHLIWDCQFVTRETFTHHTDMRIHCPCGLYFWAGVRRPTYRHRDPRSGHMGDARTVEEHIFQAMRR